MKRKDLRVGMPVWARDGPHGWIASTILEIGPAAPAMTFDKTRSPSVQIVYATPVKLLQSGKAFWRESWALQLRNPLLGAADEPIFGYVEENVPEYESSQDERPPRKCRRCNGPLSRHNARLTCRLCWLKRINYSDPDYSGLAKAIIASRQHPDLDLEALVSEQGRLSASRRENMKYTDGIPFLSLRGKLEVLRGCIENDAKEDAVGHLFDLLYLVAPGYKLGDLDGVNDLCQQYGRTPALIKKKDAIVPPFRPALVARFIRKEYKQGVESFFLDDWHDYEGAMFELGAYLDLWPDTDEDKLAFSVRFKHIVCSSNYISECLSAAIDKLVDYGILDRREEPDIQFKTRPIEEMD